MEFRGESSGGVVKYRLFPQATYLVNRFYLFKVVGFLVLKMSLFIYVVKRLCSKVTGHLFVQANLSVARFNLP